MEYIEIFPEATITEWPDSYDRNGVYVYSIETPKLPVVEGEKYIVEWDGVRYECVAYNIGGNSERLAIGDITFADPDATGGNGEPFAFWIYHDKNYGYLDTLVEGTHTVCIYQGTKPGTEEPIGYIEYLVNPKYRMGKPFRGFFGWKLAQKGAE